MTFTYETLPTDAKSAIREMKAELRQQIGDVQQVFDKLSAKIEARVAEIGRPSKGKDYRFGRKSHIATLQQVQ